MEENEVCCLNCGWSGVPDECFWQDEEDHYELICRQCSDYIVYLEDMVLTNFY